ncbi:uncharacterized protein LOC106159959 [Lingula anatina]|uniref:Uncharacterized protein LOC106159959 n=1 Tax=Lingula anatina TaxID=7574 RepID=A0A1S3I249_LINAN|nr:uncharacterized protein LOC106159959 [Lingula anatina]XP_013391906.1 uncharacterized protein LOC106159959 [Lingula anatina]|eukprot:XP_013391899.1 uncharacterized protein LOC106159959 [Lingula anatina]
MDYRRRLLVLVFVLFKDVYPEGSKVKTKLYHEQWRPQYHFTAEVNMMNDPCGLVAYGGKWHLFYQYDPVGVKPNRYTSWGHAVSDDLIHWDHWPLAIPETVGVVAYSGSTVVDVHNTTGFSCNGAVPLVAVFAGDNWYTHAADERLSYSLDGGMTWTKYVNNPVLSNGHTHFRDPKVFWYEPTKRWIMAVAQAQGRIRFHFYSSPNLKNWTHLSEMGPDGTIPNKEWECPDLFQIPIEGENTKKWVVPVVTGIGSVPRRSVLYFVGEFDGTSYKSDKPKAKLMDYGQDFTAGNTWNNHIDNRRLYIAWMCVWETCSSIPTTPFIGAQSMIRELFLERENNEVLLVQRPIKEMEMLRVKKTLEVANTDIASVQKKLSEQPLRGRLLEIKAEIRPKAGTKDVGIIVMKGAKEETRIGYRHTKSSRSVYIDRTSSGFMHPKMSRVDLAPVVLQNGVVKLWIFVDWSSVELFANNGRQVITSRIFPNETSDGVDVYVSGSDVDIVTMEIYELKTTWDRYWPDMKPRDSKPVKLGTVVKLASQSDRDLQARGSQNSETCFKQLMYNVMYLDAIVIFAVFIFMTRRGRLRWFPSR